MDRRATMHESDHYEPAHTHVTSAEPHANYYVQPLLNLVGQGFGVSTTADSSCASRRSTSPRTWCRASTTFEPCTPTTQRPTPAVGHSATTNKTRHDKRVTTNASRRRQRRRRRARRARRQTRCICDLSMPAHERSRLVQSGPGAAAPGRRRSWPLSDRAAVTGCGTTLGR